MTKPRYIVKWIYTKSVNQPRYPERSAMRFWVCRARTDSPMRVHGQILALGFARDPGRSVAICRSFEPQNSALFKSDCRSSTCMGRDARGMQGCLCLSADLSPDKWSMQFNHDLCPQNKMTCEAPRKPAKNPHHDGMLGASWLHSLVWSSHARDDQRRSDTEAPALLPCRLCHVCQAVPAFPLWTNCHPSSHAVLLHALRSDCLRTVAPQ